MRRLTTAQLDRACGAVLASAVGDALGAGYEFGCATVGPGGPAMIGGGLGGFAQGEWTDDTSMAWCVLDAVAKGEDLRSSQGLDVVAAGFRRWYESGPADIGVQTARVLRAAGRDASALSMASVAADLHARTGRAGGNGSLMRTAAVALPYLDDPSRLGPGGPRTSGSAAVADAAWKVSDLTHTDPRAGEACVIWSCAIRHAIVHGELDVRVGLDHLEEPAAAWWGERIDEAETLDPSTFNPNGYVVPALQAAWAAIAQTPVPEAPFAGRHLVDALEAAIRIGHDTDTVAAIAGALLGARWGASAVPARWRRILHGYPGKTSDDLVAAAHLTVRGPGPYGWPLAERLPYDGWSRRHTLARYPFDDGVWLGGAGSLDTLPEDVTAVVSLCLVGCEEVPKGVEHVSFRLVDSPDPESNPNLDLVIRDAAETVRALREEGHVVLLHCVEAYSRTPTVAIAYAMLSGIDLETATKGVCSALPGASPNLAFTAALSKGK